MKKLKLFCIPYAGGSASIYHKWKKYFEDYVDIYPIELAGRGRRFGETPYSDLNDIVDDAYDNIKYMINDGPYMILGHSMGALIAFELIYKIKEKGDNVPIHTYFSGKGAPQINSYEDRICHLPDKEFMEEVFSLGGTPKELLQEKELLELFTRILRADYEAIENYKYIDRLDKFEFPISIFNGRDDKLTRKKIVNWNIHTKKECRIYNFEGGHFFINDKIKELSDIINRDVNEYYDITRIIERQTV